MDILALPFRKITQGGCSCLKSHSREIKLSLSVLTANSTSLLFAFNKRYEKLINADNYFFAVIVYE